MTIQAGLVDVPWSRDGFRVRVFPFALKGHAMTAPGNALGIMLFPPVRPVAGGASPPILSRTPGDWRSCQQGGRGFEADTSSVRCLRPGWAGTGL